MMKSLLSPLVFLFDTISEKLYLRKVESIILLEGLQSGGSTLVSACFLQHPNANGILDLFHFSAMHNFFRCHRRQILKSGFTFKAPDLVVKFTCGHYNVHEMLKSFTAYEERIVPVAIVRDPRSVVSSWLRRFGSLENVYSGYTGKSGNFWDTPIKPWDRIARFCDDLKWYKDNGHPIITYEKLCINPEQTLMKACEQIGLPYSRDMITWPKPDHDMLNTGGGNIHGPKLDKDLAKCNCVFDEHMLERIQTDFDVLFEVGGYPLIEKPYSFKYSLDDIGNLIPSKE